MAPATLIIRERRVDASGGVLEIKVWQVPTPVPPSEHDFKYSLYYGRNGERLVGFDNERGKGDHMHLLGEERPYMFTTLKALLADFFAEVKRLEGDGA
jgi:hypothetical protein